MPILKFKKATVFLDADVSANKSAFSDEGSGFKFSRSILAIGAQYKPDNTLKAEARAFVTAQPSYKGMGVKANLSKYWDANSFSMRGSLQKGKRSRFTFEETTEETTDEDGETSSETVFEYVESLGDETKTDLSANINLSGGKLPKDVRISANARYSKTESEQTKYSNTSLQLSVQKEFGEFLKYSSRPKIVGRLNFTRANKLSAELSYQREVLNRQKIQLTFVPKIELGKNYYGDELFLTTSLDTRLSWRPTDKQDISTSLKLSKKLTSSDLYTYNFQLNHNYRFTQNWSARNSLSSSKYRDQISISYSPRLSWYKENLGAELYANYRKNFSSDAVDKSVGSRFTLRSKYPSEINYQLSLGGKINWYSSGTIDRRIEASLRFGF